MDNNSKFINYINYLLNGNDENDKDCNYADVEKYINYAIDRNTLTPDESKFALYILRLSPSKKRKVRDFNQVYKDFISKDKVNLER